MKNIIRSATVLVLAIVLFGILLAAQRTAPTLRRVEAGGDWPDWRGPNRDGTSPEKGLPSQWSPSGQNLAWKAPYGARSGPVVYRDHLYLQNSAGKGAALQERIVALNADTGRLLWEHKFNVYLSDVPPHRVGWASPAVDATTGNVYALGVGGVLLSLSPDGKLLWQRSLGEDFGLVTTHGGRTVSPVIEGDLAIVSGITSGWGNQARGAHRFMAFDKKSGATVWVNSPGDRPFDTTYAPPIAAVISGVRLLIAGGSDGAMHAFKPLTGEPVWKFPMSKRGLNTGAVLKGTTVFVSHSEENFDTSEMGLLAALDGTATGSIAPKQVKWAIKNFQGGYSSPVIDGERLYQVDNGSVLYAFDTGSGKQVWRMNLGTIQKSSPVLADGKLYVGTENGKFYILKPGPAKAEILDEDLMGTEAQPEAIIGSPAISRGRIYLPTMDALYCIGKRSAAAVPAPAVADYSPVSGAATFLQVWPTELVLKPGDSVQLHTRMFNNQGRPVKDEPVTWVVQGLKGTVTPDGKFTAATEAVSQAGEVKASAGALSGGARIRVVPPLPWAWDFEALPKDLVPPHWVNATGKFQVRPRGNSKVLVKLADNAFTKRARAFLGQSNFANYTVEADVSAETKRRQMGDAGVVAQRYALVLFGNHQRLELQPWQPETERTVAVPFEWKPDTWYHLKLRVENQPGGKVRVLGKAWPSADPEPAQWSIERVDPIGNREGSPGIYADAPFEVFFDNLKVYPNQ